MDYVEIDGCKHETVPSVEPALASATAPEEEDEEECGNLAIEPAHSSMKRPA